MITRRTHLKAVHPLGEREQGILRDRRPASSALMNLRLASAVDLQMQMKQALWNSHGPSCIPLSELFDQLARSVDSYADLIAQRIVQLGGVAQGTVRYSAITSGLDEYPLAIAGGVAHVEAVAHALESFGRETRGAISELTEMEDAISAGVFAEISRGIDQWLRFIEACSQT